MTFDSITLMAVNSTDSRLLLHSSTVIAMVHIVRKRGSSMPAM